MITKILKAFLKEKFDLKIKSVEFGNGYYVKAYNYDSQGGSYDLITKYDKFGDVLANKLFFNISDILIAIKSSKDYKGELELLWKIK